MLANEIQTILQQPININTVADNLALSESLKLVKGEIRRLDADRKSFTDPINEQIARIIARYKEAIDPLKQYENVAKEAMIIWDNAERQRIAAENERRRIEAEAQEAKLRAEKAKQEAAWRAKEEAARQELAKQEALIASAKSEAARALAEAAAAKARAEQEKAAATAAQRREQAEAIQVVAPIVEQVKAVGTSVRSKWRAEVINAALVPREHCVPDQKRLDKLVNAMGGQIEIAGVRNVEEKIMSSSSR